mmetsp:Transcript_11853/g.25652  ORF Transcript_11853/g.25652 Transcript_11853/m.25652 type:complete len:93 (-) Transcript_11853:353-631(-)
MSASRWTLGFPRAAAWAAAAVAAAGEGRCSGGSSESGMFPHRAPLRIRRRHVAPSRLARFDWCAVRLTWQAVPLVFDAQLAAQWHVPCPLRH